MVNKIDTPIVLPERKWVQPKGSKSYYLDVEEKTHKLALNRFKAAKVAADEVQKKEATFIKHKKESFSDFSVNTFNKDINKIPLNKQVDELAHRCKHLYEKLSVIENKITPKYMRSLREEINKALKLLAKIPKSQEKDTLFKECCSFLQHLSYQINTQAESMKSIEDLGQSALKVRSSYTNENGDVVYRNLSSDFNIAPVGFNEFSTWIEDIFTRLKNDRKDTTLGAIKWAIINFLRSLFGNALSNENMWIGDFKVGNKNIRLNLGQSFVKEPIGQAQLQYQADNQQYHIQHTLEDPTKKSESKRIGQHGELFNKYTENSKVIASTINGDIRKGKGEFKEVNSVADFYKKLEKMLDKKQITDKNFNGFATGLTPEEIKETVAASKEAFEKIFGVENFDITDKKAQKRYRNAMLLGFTGFLAVKNLLKFGTDAALPNNATMGQACKQDVDRGPIVNTTMIAFVQMIANGELRGQDAKQLIGTLMMRGMTVDGRVMNRDRLEVLLDLFDLIGNAGKSGQNKFVEKLQAFAGKTIENPNPITFIPSHEVKVN